VPGCPCFRAQALARHGLPNIGDEDIAFTEKDKKALTTIIELVRREQLTEDAAISITRAVGR
jgi:adenylate cyclase